MNVKKIEILDTIKNEAMKSLYPLKMSGNINDDLIPKALLSGIYLLPVGISSENHIRYNKKLDEISIRLMDCFNMIISGKSVDDLKTESDEPRII
ncbi:MULTISPECIES: hypothetical protein [Photorhabdus]|uniref:hypothetical protein n=1 Tax=Photorhabdus TaxID=29487 RepID=UPI00223E0BB1|nr:hypothetical protein [Photorhabdus aballayi]MCW7550944.1 hypothetical protein [Photorhabdus aballayi]MCW7764650.1 hypothetical protein [Photorhabdus luminescens subsp. venezuelensis]